jgi:hypothetical protein
MGEYSYKTNRYKEAIMGELAEMERRIEEDSIIYTEDEFPEMEKCIEEYFSAVSDEQLMKDLKKAGYKGKLDNIGKWFVRGLAVGTALAALGCLIGMLIVWAVS